MFSWITWMTIACHSHTHTHSCQSADCEATPPLLPGPSKVLRSEKNKQLASGEIVDFQPFFISCIIICSQSLLYLYFYESMQPSLPQFNLGSW
jgi:hypothetical protein